VEAAEQRFIAPASNASALCDSRIQPLPVRRSRVISISSGKGGVGKTNTTVNLAIALAQAGHRTILLDADLGMANADVLCGLSPTRRLEHYVGVSDLTVAGRPQTPNDAAALARRSLQELAVDAPGGFRLIPGSVGVTRMAELSTRERARLMAGLVELDRETDYLLIDTGAGLGRDVIAFMEVADLAIVVATPEPTSIADAYALIKCAHNHAQEAHALRRSSGAAEPHIALLVNQASAQAEADAVHARMSAVSARFLGAPLRSLGWISQDQRVVAAVRARRPVLLDSPGAAASRDLQRLARVVTKELGGESAPSQRPKGISGWLSRLVLRGG
jgi:flagellar biosynthesis protein FlhG